MTFKDTFPGLSRTLSFNFQDFPGPGIFKKKNPGLSRRRGNPGLSTMPANKTLSQLHRRLTTVKSVHSNVSVSSLCSTLAVQSAALQSLHSSADTFLLTLQFVTFPVELRFTSGFPFQLLYACHTAKYTPKSEQQQQRTHLILLFPVNWHQSEIVITHCHYMHGDL